MLAGKKIIVAVTGSIAAYKAASLVRLLVKADAEVKVIMTTAAKDFITPLTLSTLSRHPVMCDPFDPADGTWKSHVDLGRWADAMLIAPATANTLARMAHGVADNFLLTVFLSARCPVFFAPAMDLDMYKHPATQENIRTLLNRGCHLIEPQVGELASGLSGEGRMEEPERMVDALSAFFEGQESLTGKTFLVTAGPTYESIDPVRYLANHSTGTMGFELAREAAKRGASVLLVTGPVNLSADHPHIQRVNVTSAKDMYEQCLNHFPACDVCIMSAAVADYTPIRPAGQKIKKQKEIWFLELQPTKDILDAMGKIKKPGQRLIGFALETTHELSNASEKLKNKNLDMIVLNSLSDTGAGFGYSTNKVTIIGRDGRHEAHEIKAKAEVAKDIIDWIVQSLKNPKNGNK